jgi:hypothetical protein
MAIRMHQCIRQLLGQCMRASRISISEVLASNIVWHIAKYPVKVGIVGSFHPRSRSSLLPPKKDIRTSFRVCLRHLQVTASPNPRLFHHINVNLRLPRPGKPRHSTSLDRTGAPTSANHTYSGRGFVRELLSRIKVDTRLYRAQKAH